MDSIVAAIVLIEVSEVAVVDKVKIRPFSEPVS